MLNAGLSYSQAPPFGAPLRFFLTVPFFLAAAGCLGLADTALWPLAPLSPVGLAMTHLLTVGVLAMVMTGALLQMLPVILGVPVPVVLWVARLTHAGLSIGTVLLASGFLLENPNLLSAGGILLLLGGGFFSLMTGSALTRAGKIRSGYGLAILGLLGALGLGIVLLYAYNGAVNLADINRQLHLHMAWGMAGWILMLIVTVSFQVVPMLQVTPAYPAFAQRWLDRTLFMALIGYSLSAALPESVRRIGDWIAESMLLPILFVAGLYAILTLRLFRQRRRKISDNTLRFWHLGLYCLLACVLIFPLTHLDACPASVNTALGILFMLGFALSIVCGMLYKIVPFLAWFHLQAQGRRDAPSMRELLPEKATRHHLGLHGASLTLLSLSPWLPVTLVWLGLAMLIASATLFGFNVWQVYRQFRTLGGH